MVKTLNKQFGTLYKLQFDSSTAGRVGYIEGPVCKSQILNCRCHILILCTVSFNVVIDYDGIREFDTACNGLWCILGHSHQIRYCLRLISRSSFLSDLNISGH